MSMSNVRRVLAVLVALLAPSVARAQLEPQPTQDQPLAPLPPPSLENAPSLLNQVEPVYPEAARASQRGGAVVVRIVIDVDGSVERADVIGSAATTPDDEAGKALDWAALGAVTNFVFVPATFCVPFRPDAENHPELVDKRCGEPGKVAIDYQQTFTFTEEKVEVPVEAPEVTQARGGVLNFAGVVREAATKDPLEGVEVVVEVEKANAPANAAEADKVELITGYTNEDGRFEFRGIPNGTHQVTFALASYDTSFTDETFEEGKKTEVVVYLTPADTNKFETVVRRKRAQKDVAKVSLTRDEVRKVPGTFGDPIRVIENLPGLARAPFFGGALIVRGANPQDSGVYFDGVEIPILYHFGGLTSVVNAEFLENIDFYPGGFGAYYGRATAGIVDVESRALTMKGFRGYAEVDLIDSGFFFAGPVKVGELPKITFAAAARRSYIDGILPVILDAFIGPNGQGIIASPVYWDYQTKIESEPLPGHKLSLFLFGSDDDLKVITRGLGNNNSLDVGFHETFHRLVGRWDWKLAPGVSHRMQPFIGLTRIELQSSNQGDGPDVEAGIGIDVYNWGLRDELKLRVSDALTVRAGLDYVGQTFGVKFNVPLPLEIGSFPRVFPRIEGSNQEFGSEGFINSSAIYLEGELEPIKHLRIIPGVRAELTVFTFLPSEVAKNVEAAAGQATQFHIDPRLTARWELMPQTTIKGAIGTYRQQPQPNELAPQTGNPDVVEPRAVQLIAGIEQGLTENINIDVQAYYTNRDLLVQSTSATRSKNDGSGEVQPLFYTNGGRGRTLGLEVLLRHEITEYLYGWVAYTLSRTEIDIDENDKSYFLTDFDQTHILTVVLQTNLPWGFTLGGRFRAVSGNPTALPLGSVHDLDTTNYLTLGSAPQSSRLPTFHQLDLRVDRKFVFDTFSLTAYLDLLNVYNQQNAEGFLDDFRAREREPIPSLPILPVIGMSGEF